LRRELDEKGSTDEVKKEEKTLESLSSLPVREDEEKRQGLIIVVGKKRPRKEWTRDWE
jgi:hypothetical protein